MTLVIKLNGTVEEIGSDSRGEPEIVVHIGSINHVVHLAVSYDEAREAAALLYRAVTLTVTLEPA